VLANLDVVGIAAGFRPRTPARWISGFLAFMAASLGAIWSFEALRFGVTGDLPDSVGPVWWLHLGIALDLALVVPGTRWRRSCCGGAGPGATCRRPRLPCSAS
jgi:hypothetical protein